MNKEEGKMLENISLNKTQTKIQYQTPNASASKLNIAKSIGKDSIHFGSKNELNDKIITPPEVIEMQKNKNLPITVDAEKIKRNELIKRAQKGDKEALSTDTIKKIIDFEKKDMGTGEPIKYNFLDYPKLYRHVTKGEVENLLNGSIITPKGHPDIRIDVTNNPNYWQRPYKITFKLKDNLNPLLSRDYTSKKIPYVQPKNMQEAEHWLFGGYTLDDVECIEKRLKNGSFKKIKLTQPLEKQSFISRFLDALNILKRIK